MKPPPRRFTRPVGRSAQIGAGWTAVADTIVHSPTSAVLMTLAGFDSHDVFFFADFLPSSHLYLRRRTARTLRRRTCSIANHCSQLSDQRDAGLHGTACRRAEAAASTTASRRRLKTFPWTLHPDTGKQTGGCFVMRPRSPSRGDNVYDSVIVTVTVQCFDIVGCASERAPGL